MFFIVVFYEGRAQEVWVSREMDVVENDSIDAVTGSAVVFFAEDDMNPEESCFIDVLYPYVFEQYVRKVVLVATGYAERGIGAGIEDVTVFDGHVLQRLSLVAAVVTMSSDVYGVSHIGPKRSPLYLDIPCSAPIPPAMVVERNAVV